ncbi:YhcN/YlaJ family sporulation lipoprotein [Virgibacillus flavescens]|uniref:YhcN/YlaJ family sporulation lipoprotein n=1 Tax=Virgibacillus flavescens TaxID=1611422 RepID=UPI003D3589F0
MKLKILFLTIFVLVAGCTNDGKNESDNTTSPETQPLHYETENERNARLGIRKKSLGEQGGYPQTQQLEINRGDVETGNNTDIFTNEQSIQISNHLKKLREIKMAQVAISEEKVIVSVMLNEHNNHDVNRMIENEVRKFEPNKTIVVYTDDKHWDRMSNLSARLKQAKLPNDLKDDIMRLFNPNRNK